MPEPPKTGGKLVRLNVPYVRPIDSGLAGHLVQSRFNPANNTGAELIGRRHGKDIVQEGTYSGGIPIRWSFTDISPDTFRWVGKRREAGEGAWRLQAELHAAPAEVAGVAWDG